MKYLHFYEILVKIQSGNSLAQSGKSLKFVKTVKILHGYYVLNKILGFL